MSLHCKSYPSDRYYPVIVVGGGHAGCEAALASARIGVETLLLTMDLSAIALMPCNPSIGGPGKGHLVREIGALGGEMASCIDRTCIQMKWLNTSRGPAVRSRRAQADKFEYRRKMFATLFSTRNLTVRQANVTSVNLKSDRVCSVETETGVVYSCDELVLATGTNLNSRIIIGSCSWPGGPNNQRSAIALSESLKKNGINLRRLQTATPPRIHKDSIDFAGLKELPGDLNAGGFLWENRNRVYESQQSCHLTFTGPETIAAVKSHIDDSPLKLGNISKVGPKHCPSIDRKVIKFPDIMQHQIFLEPEGINSLEVYLQGLTTAMPPDAQHDIIRTVPGLRNAKILRYGYAIEYDALAAGSIHSTMASRNVGGLFTAGQINGTSGYEEAAAQGLIAGINAAREYLGKILYKPSRTVSYIGVLADDLAVREEPEPYRMTPGNAEFRLFLRDDTAERRLTRDGFQLGLVPGKRFDEIDLWKRRIENEISRLNETTVAPSEMLVEQLRITGTGGLKKRVSAAELLQRPSMDYIRLCSLVPQLSDSPERLTARDEIECVEIDIHYGGYAARENDRLQETKFLESIDLPLTLPEVEAKLLSQNLLSLISSKRFDNLAQLVRKNCLSRSELAMLVASLQNACNRILKVEKNGG